MSLSSSGLVSLVQTFSQIAIFALLVFPICNLRKCVIQIANLAYVYDDICHLPKKSLFDHMLLRAAGFFTMLVTNNVL